MANVKVFAVDVTIGVSDKRQIIFSLLKNRIEEGVFDWTIEFELKEKVDKEWTTRVKVKVYLLDEAAKRRAAKVEEKQKLEAAKQHNLMTKALDRARKLPPGTTSDKRLEALLGETI